jgi:hypothetical protein
MNDYKDIIGRSVAIAAALLLACGGGVNQDSLPHTLAGGDGRRLFFSDNLLDIDVTYDRRLLARVEPYNPKNPVYVFPIFVHDLRTGQKKVVTERAYYPVFSPDGEWIAYQKAVGYGDLWLVKSDGSSDRPLVEFPGMETPTSWSPDGKKILFDTSPLDDEIWYYDLEEAKPFFVFKDTTPHGNIVLSPVWAASGDEIFFCRETATGAVISRINADGTGLVDIWPYDRASHEVGLKAAFPYRDRLLLTVSEKLESGGEFETRLAAWFFFLKSGRFEQLTYNLNPSRIKDRPVRLCPDNVLVFASRHLDENDKTGLYVIKTP